VGFDAEVVYNGRGFKKIPWISGQLAYLLGIAKTLLRNRTQDITISIDDKTFGQRILLTAVANGRYYGGGMLPVPEAEINDGFFDLCVVKALGRIKILFLFPKYIKGTHEKLKEVTFYRGKRVLIHSGDEMSVNIDGEVLRLRKLEFEIIPSAVNIIVPSEG
jgi:diacylglycerol kinase (ATP)